MLSIDALRGLAALGVVLYHAIQQTKEPIAPGVLKWTALLIQFVSGYGYVGVFLFFVISGFCIHLQWARARAAGATGEIRFRAFWKRRIRRLYPPYLIALALFLLIAALTTGAASYGGSAPWNPRPVARPHQPILEPLIAAGGGTEVAWSPRIQIIAHSAVSLRQA